MANTVAILEQGGNVATAAEYAHEYVNGGKSDWHLPSKDELNELYLRQTVVGGFVGVYWSSSEIYTSSAWLQFFSNGLQSDLLGKTSSALVRPVRAF